ncbi:hypothetical protein ADK65_33085 [Streptomyces sp. NRRL B-1140]|uniref:hypothetical protein n=1 Tax=Streptomyces sp. NRRL B-1140 TaxID=1415549 RepID=UPI0006AFA6A5|nr:hypothetical protein [Streptomyces sp. NRRL B-1140]KOV93325.1 hypothetical protein ADK65_33085 [Streptomyces sp. NRRL B-1140]
MKKRITALAVLALASSLLTSTPAFADWQADIDTEASTTVDHGKADAYSAISYEAESKVIYR